jgi:hypothetical protein
MSINILPPELLRQILSDLSDYPCSSSYEPHRQRNRDLQSCSLVCSTWRTIAQELLPDEIWFNKASEGDKRLELLVWTLNQGVFRLLRTTRLIIHCWRPMGGVLWRTTDGQVDSRWISVKFLQVVNANLIVQNIAPLVSAYPILDSLASLFGS